MGSYEHELSTLRKDIFLTAYRGGMAHLASAFSCVEIIYVLYCRNAMRHDPARPDWAERDRFILSKGHGSLALYTVLCKAGYFAKDTLASFCTPDTALGGEPKSLCPARHRGVHRLFWDTDCHSASAWLLLSRQTERHSGCLCSLATVSARKAPCGRL